MNHGFNTKVDFSRITEKIRANIASKKNRLLGRSNKSRLQGPSFGSEDYNGNSSYRPSLGATEAASIASKADLRPREFGKRVPREDKNMKHALYRPTLICMAAIETPAESKADHVKQKTSDRNIPGMQLSSNPSPTA